MNVERTSNPPGHYVMEGEVNGKSFTREFVDIDAYNALQAKYADLLAAAVRMLAEWTLAVELNGPKWDHWNEYYKNAAHRPGPLRELIDVERKRLMSDDHVWKQKAQDNEC